MRHRGGGEGSKEGMRMHEWRADTVKQSVHTAMHRWLQIQLPLLHRGGCNECEGEEVAAWHSSVEAKETTAMRWCEIRAERLLLCCVQ